MGLPVGEAWGALGLGHEGFQHKSTGWLPDFMIQTWLSQVPHSASGSLDPGKVTL